MWRKHVWSLCSAFDYVFHPTTWRNSCLYHFHSMLFSVSMVSDCHTEARNFTLQKVPYFPSISTQESLWSRASAATGSSVAPIWPLEGHFMVDGLCSRNHCRCNCKLIKNHICCTTKTTTMYIATRWRHDLQWSKSTTVDALIQDAAAVPQRWWSGCRRNAYTIPPMSAIKIFARWGCRFSNVLFMIKIMIIIIVVISSIPTDDIQWEAALAGAGHHRSGGTCL